MRAELCRSRPRLSRVWLGQLCVGEVLDLVSWEPRWYLLLRTGTPGTYRRVERRYEVGHDGICIVQPSEDRDDVGAWIRVFLGEGGV